MGQKQPRASAEAASGSISDSSSAEEESFTEAGHGGGAAGGQAAAGPAETGDPALDGFLEEWQGVRRGPWFNPQTADRLMAKGQWSSDPCSGIALDLECSCATFTPCILVWAMLHKVGNVPGPGPIKRFSSRHFLVASLGLAAVLALAYCGSGDQAGSSVLGLLAGVSLVVGVVMIAWWLMFVAVRGLRDKLRVQEDDETTAGKCICMPPCFVAQVSRHVNKMLGYKGFMVL